MTRYSAFLILWLTTAIAAFAGERDVVAQVEALLNPQSRFLLRELQPNGSYGLRTLSGHYSAVSGVQSFAIDGVVGGYRLIIDVGSDGQSKARLTETADKTNSAGSAITVSLNDGKYDRTDQTLEGRLKADGGQPQTVVFGVYWDLWPTGSGPDAVEYTLAFRTIPAGAVTVVHCHHDLRGTPLEAPHRAAADVAVGAILAEANALLISVSSLGGATAEDRARLLPRIQPLIDTAILEIDKLAHYTHAASPIVVRQATSALAQTTRVATALQQLRDRKVAETYLSRSDQSRIEATLGSWVSSGIPVTKGNKP